MSFDDVLERVLRDEGWDVSRGPVDDSLLAESAGERILLTWTSGGAEAAEGGAEVFTAQADAKPADDDGGGAEVLETDPPAAEPDGDDGGAEVLETDEPAAEPADDGGGAEVLETGGPADGPDETGTDFLDATVDEPEPEPEAGGPDAAGTTPSREGAGSGPARGEPADEGVPEEVPVVRLRVDRQEAEDEAREKVVDVQETILELVPHLAYEYTCRVPDGTGDEETYRGTVLLNALTENVVDLEAPRFADGVPEGARLLDPELEPGEAVSEARAHLDQRFTRDVKVEEGDGNVSVMETRRVSPSKDGVDLDAQGTWYVPVWRIEGGNGSVRIDANRGQVLDESLQQATGTDAEWVA